MAKRIGGIEQFLENVVHGVPDPDNRWAPEEGSEVEDICEFLLGFQDGDYMSGDIPVEFIEQDGGGEGGGEHCETVVKIGTTYYKIVYSYYSYDGYNYDGADVYEVVPVERLVTFYE